MTSREIVIANLNHKNAPRPAFHHPEDGRINDFNIVGVFSANHSQRRWVEGSKEFYDDEWGNIWWREVDGCVKGEIYKPFLDDWSKLDSMNPPNYNNPQIYEDARISFSNEKEKFRLGHIGGWIFDNARYMRKLENFFMDLYDYPDEVHRLNEIIANVYEAKIRNIAKCGADGIFIGEDLGTQRGLLMSPDSWREYFKPHYQRLISLAHQLGMKVFLHSCGYNWELIDDLCDVGIDCLQFDQPALYDMPALAEKLRKNKVALWSPLDIQKILPTGDRNYIEAEAAHMVEIFKGGLIINQYSDLQGIGVKPEWDQWAYDSFVKNSN